MRLFLKLTMLQSAEPWTAQWLTMLLYMFSLVDHDFLQVRSQFYS